MRVLGNKVAAYLRLSREDGDKQESDSIRNQRELITEYISKNKNLNFIGEYVDDGYSGTSFERPNFQRLMEDARTGKVNCVIVKDLSRLGRNYIETGRYIEQIFPLLGVRFISILDHYDSAEKDSTSDWLIVPFKNLINDAYARDISVKIRSQLDVKRKNGKFIGSFACYGYDKDPKDPNHIIIDPYAADIVRMIFRMKLSGCNQTGIAERLNKMGILPPAAYKRKNGMKFNCGFHWSADPKWEASSVRSILCNEIYTGTMVQGIHNKISYKMKQSTLVEKEDWIRVAQTHEAIVEKPVFDEIQRMMEHDTRTSPGQKEVYALSGLVFCGDCGNSMVRKRSRGYSYLQCKTYKNGCGCAPHYVSTDKLERLVLEGIQKQIEMLLNAEEILKKIDRIPEEQVYVRAVTKHIKELENEIERFQRLKTQVYADMLSETISKEEYEVINNRFTAGLDSAVQKRNEQIELKARLMKNNTHQKPWIEIFRQYQNIQTLDREIAVMLIDHVVVYSKKHIEVVLCYQDEIQEMLRLVETKETQTEEGEMTCAS